MHLYELTAVKLISFYLKPWTYQSPLIVADKQNVFSVNLNVFLRTIIHWPAFLCWVTRSPSPQSPKTSTKTTSSNCISSLTSTISDRRVNTLLRGTDAHLLNIFGVLWGPWCQRFDQKPPSACRWMEVIRSATVPSSGARVLNHKESHPHWVGSPGFHSPSPSGGICPSCPRLESLLFFSTHLWDICTCVHAHFGAF